MKNNLDTKDWIYVISAVVSMGIAYGTVTTKLSAQDKKIDSLVSVPENLAAINQHLSSIDKQANEQGLDIRDIRNYLLTKDRHTSLSGLDSKVINSYP